MYDIYYNPATMSNPGTVLVNVGKVDLNDKFTKMRLRMHTPYKTRKDAESESFACDVYFYENGELYRATRIADWQWKPCYKIACDAGINWQTYYAPTVELLHEHLEARFGRKLEFTPILNECGLYEIQVHYDGRCR